MELITLPNDIHIQGSLTVGGAFTLPANCVGNTQIISAAGNYVASTKVKRRHTISYMQGVGTEPAASLVLPFYSVYGATLTIVAVLLGHSQIPTGTTSHTTLDVKKNNVSVLSSAKVLNPATAAARAAVAASVNTSGAVAGDLYELLITSSAGDGAKGQGFFVFMVVDEDPLP